MAPNTAYIKINKQVALPIRVFVNRTEILENFKKTTSSINNDDFQENNLNSLQKSVFEAPVLSSNSIIRLKKPLVKLYLSNKDLHDLVDDMKNDLLFIIYELSDDLLVSEVLNKMKIESFLEFYQITQFIVSKNNLKIKDQNVNINGLPISCKKIYKLGKFKYSVIFDGNWGCNIIINDIRVLKKISKTVKLNNWKIDDLEWENLMKNNARAKATLKDEDAEDGTSDAEEDPDSFDENDYTYINGPANSSQVLLRTLKKQKSSTSSTAATHILQEDEEELEKDNLLFGSNEMPTKEDKKFEANYDYRSISNLGKCIDVHVLKRPKHRRT